MFGRGEVQHDLQFLLPESFQPKELLGADSCQPLLMETQQNRVQLAKRGSEKLEARKDDALFQRAAQEALAQARGAYAPYTQCPAGCAIITLDGQVFGGSYIESNAFNPSLSPFQAAAIAAVKGGITDYSCIAEVVLTERSCNKVKHSSNIQQLLKSMVAGKGKTAPFTRLVLTALPPKH